MEDYTGTDETGKYQLNENLKEQVFQELLRKQIVY
jgi:hypothetical protein